VPMRKVPEVHWSYLKVRETYQILEATPIGFRCSVDSVVGAAILCVAISLSWSYGEGIAGPNESRAIDKSKLSDDRMKGIPVRREASCRVSRRD
jgi:hypothetical protein